MALNDTDGLRGLGWFQRAFITVGCLYAALLLMVPIGALSPKARKWLLWFFNPFIWLFNLFNWLYNLFNDILFYHSSIGYEFLILLGCFLGGALLGVFEGKHLFGEEGAFGLRANRRMEKIGKVVLCLGSVCLYTIIGMSLRPGFHYDKAVTGWKTLDGKEVQVGSVEVPDDSLGILGPIEVPRGDMEVGVRVQQEIEEGSGGGWSHYNFITVALLDESKDYLLSFGGEVWNYAGTDDGERWQEEDTQYAATLAFPSPGMYYLQLRTESSYGLRRDASPMSPIYVEMYGRASWGNPAPLRWAAYLAFFFGGLCLVASRRRKDLLIRRHIEEGGAVQYEGITWRISNELQCTYENWKATEWVLQPTDPGAKVPRYLEREYEERSDWESWIISRPVSLEEMRCEGPDGDEMTVREYVEQHDDLPDAVMHEDRRYQLEGLGTVRRGHTPVDYYNYSGSDNGFVTFEGTPGESLDAVVGGPIELTDLSVVLEESDSG